MRDFDRTLKRRGQRDARLIGKLIPEKRVRLDLVISSPAARAQETAKLLVESAEFMGALCYDERIYEADVRGLLEVITQVEEKANTVMLVGHNPGLEDLLSSLTGHTEHMPTAALAKIDLDLEQWSEVREQSGRLEWLVKPKELAND